MGSLSLPEGGKFHTGEPQDKPQHVDCCGEVGAKTSAFPQRSGQEGCGSLLFPWALAAE